MALASEERVSSSFSVFSILGGSDVMLSGHHSQCQTPGDPTHAASVEPQGIRPCPSVKTREVLPAGGNHTSHRSRAWALLAW